jgi:WD40 repeat protein
MHVIAMDFYGNQTLLTLMDKEKTEQQESPNIHLHVQIQTHRETNEQEHFQFSPPRHSTNFPQSPWTLSHLPSPSPSLLYHCIASLHRHEGNIYSIAVSKGFIFTGSNSSRIRVWKQPDCMDKGCLKSNSGSVRAILAYNNMVFSTHKDNKIRIWNFDVSDNFKSKKVATLPRRTKNSILNFNRTKNNKHKHKETISCMAYYHSEGLFYTGSHDRTVKAWRISDRKCVDSFLAHEDHVNSILVNQDDGCVFTCSSDGTVKIWRRVYTENSHTLTMTLKFQPSPVNALALSSSFNHCFLYSGTSDGMINFWEKERLCYRFNHGGFLQGHRFAVLCVETVGNMIFSGSEDTTIRVWRREEESCYHECLMVLDGHRGPVRCLAACLEMEKVVVGFLVYSASLDQTFKVWRIKVFSDDENVCLDVVDNKCGHCGGRVKIREYDMSPVLSPSWVEKKLQGSPFH